MITILYVHHSGVFGGASRSLLESLSVLKNKGIEPIVLLPPGTATLAFQKSNIRTINVRGLAQFDNTKYGYYRGFRWLVILRELFLFPYTFSAFYNIRKTGISFDLIHLNEITNIPSLLVIKMLFNTKIVMHVRSLQRPINSIRNKMLYAILNKWIDVFIAIDNTVANSLFKSEKVKVIHNGLNIHSSINNEITSTSKQLKEIDSYLKVVYVGNLLFMKGIVEFVHAASLAKTKQLDIKFIIVGSTKSKKNGLLKRILKMLGLSHDAEEVILKLIKEKHLDDYIKILDFTNNIKEVYSNIDVLCFPSHLNAAGRPVFEAGLFRKPSIVAIKNPESDTIEHNKTGLCIAEKNPIALLAAIEFFYNDKSKVELFGNNAYELAMNHFDVQKNSEKLLNIYKHLIC